MAVRLGGPHRPVRLSSAPVRWRAGARRREDVLWFSSLDGAARHQEVGQGRRPALAKHAATPFVAIVAIGSVTKSGLHDAEFEPVIPGRRHP